MKCAPILPGLIERFFTERLMRQQNVSPHTIASYRDTFRLLFEFVAASDYAEWVSNVIADEAGFPALAVALLVCHSA